MTRIVFMGSPDFAVPSLTALIEADGLEVVLVVTQPDKPAGRGRKLTPSAVKVVAEQRGIPVLTPPSTKKKATREAIAAHAPDIGVVAAYGHILGPKLLAVPRLGCVNVHGSLLPRHRGASPIAHAILSGDPETGITIMQMDAGMDTGPIYRRRAISIAPDDTTGTLTDKLAVVGAELLVETLPEIIAGTLPPEPQDDAGATYASLLKKEDGRLDFSSPADVLERRIRGLSPWPGTFTHLGERRIQILRATTAQGQGEPGEVIAASHAGIDVACAEGALRVLEVKPAGKKAMPASAWVAGRGVEVGARLA